MGKKVYINGTGHMAKMAAMLMYGESLQDPLLKNLMSYDLETWHGAVCTQVYTKLMMTLS